MFDNNWPLRILSTSLSFVILAACVPISAPETAPSAMTVAPTEAPTTAPTPTPITPAGPHPVEPFARFLELMGTWPESGVEARQALLDGLLGYLQDLPNGIDSLADAENMAALMEQIQPGLYFDQQLRAADLDRDGRLELLVDALPPVGVIHEDSDGFVVEDLPAPRYWVPGQTWSKVEQIIDLTGDNQPEIIISYNFPGGSYLGRELLVAERKDDSWVEGLRLPLNNWAGGGEWRVDNGTDPPVLETTCAAFGTFDAKLVAHPLQRNRYGWDGDRLAWQSLEREEPANLRQMINVLEAGLQSGHFEAALQSYRFLYLEQPNIPDEPPGATSQGKPDWMAFAALRAGQIHALLGEEEGALALLGQAEATGSTVGRLARLFRGEYEISGDPAAAWAAMLTDTEIYNEAYNEQGNLVTFPGNPLGALYPGMALAAALNSQPEAPSQGLEAVQAAWAKYGLETGSTLAEDLNGDGLDELVVVQSLTAQPDLALVWLLARGQEGWFAAPLGEWYDLKVGIQGPLPVPGAFYRAVKVGDLVRAWNGHWVVRYQDAQRWLLDSEATALCPVIFQSAMSPASEITQPERIQASATLEPIERPTPSVELTGVTLEPVVTGVRLSFLGWSPDGETLAYLEHTSEDLASLSPYPPGSLKFLNARTGRTCDSSIVFREGDYYRPRQMTWLPGGGLLVESNTQMMQGVPCGDFGPASPRAKAEASIPDPSLSPGGEYRASTEVWDNSDGILSLITRLIDEPAGQVKNTVEWRLDERLGELGLGGAWLDADSFLIYETLDQGPLLITLGEGATQVASDLFGLASIPSILDPEGVGLRAKGAVLAGTDTYHLVLFGVGLEADVPNLRLYHSETSEVEELPFRYPGGTIFSPDGAWLVTDARPVRDGYERSDLWLRPVDPDGGLFQPLTDREVSLSTWSPDWKKVAGEESGGISIFAVPGGANLGTWAGGEYNLFPLGWSPNGEYLAVSGYLRHGRGEGLFVIQVNVASSRQISGPVTTYTDYLLGFAFDIPAAWEVVGHQGAEGHIIAPSEMNGGQGILTFSVVGEGDLDFALNEVKRGAWGPYLQKTQPVRLGQMEALQLELTRGEDRPPRVWLLAAPSGQAVGFIPDGDLALAEPILFSLRAVPIQKR